MHHVSVRTAFKKLRQDVEAYHARSMVVHSNVFYPPPLYLSYKNLYRYDLI